MTPEEFRRWGHALVDWLAATAARRVAAGAVAGRARRSAGGAAPAAPEQGEEFAALLADVDRVILPGVTHWQSPSFFAYFPGNSSGPSILGELLSAGLGVQGMLWATSPACTELETHVLDWLVEMLGLPAAFGSDGPGGGVIQDSASSATLCAILAARERATAGRSNRAGCDGKLVAYASTETHSSVAKGIRIAGVGADNLRRDRRRRAFAMRPDELGARDRRRSRRGPDAVLRLRHRGDHVVRGHGSAARDRRGLPPARRVAARRRRDVRHRGALPRAALLQDGVELADSYCFDPHKWMFTNFDCTCLWVADRRALIDALSHHARVPAQPRVGVRRGHRLSRLARAARPPLPFAQALVRDPPLRGRRACGATSARTWRWRRSCGRGSRPTRASSWRRPTPLNLVCFRHRARGQREPVAARSPQREREALLTSTRLDGKLTLRLSVGQTSTERRHVEAAWGDASQPTSSHGS